MSLDSFLKFIASDGQSGSVYSRLFAVLICILPSILVALWIYFNTQDIFLLKFILIVVSIFAAPSFLFIFQDTIDKKKGDFQILEMVIHMNMLQLYFHH